MPAPLLDRSAQRPASTLARRTFVKGIAAATLAAAVPQARAQSAKPMVCVFSKHLQFLDYRKLAQTSRDLELDGVDLTVRPKGHVLPQNVQTDLPKAVEAIRAAGLDVPMITTNLNSTRDENAREILATASKLGIRYFRIGYRQYFPNGDPWLELPRFIEELRALIAIAEEHNMIAGYHNHSGYHNVGAPLWDLHHMIREIASDHFGANLDLGHTTVEGAYGDWQITTRLMAPYVKMAAVKDFVWDRDKPKWVPLGQGLVKLVDMLTILREAHFAGPISMHFEYGTPEDQIIDEVRATAQTLRNALTQAGYN